MVDFCETLTNFRFSQGAKDISILRTETKDQDFY